MNDLEKAMKPILERMTNKMTERVYETQNHFLYTYYQSYDPVSYKRREDLLRSAIKIEARPYKGGYRAAVYIDTVSGNWRAVSSGAKEDQILRCCVFRGGALDALIESGRHTT